MGAPVQHDLPLVFIGPMASGKSRIGRRVAKLIEAPFVDTDSRIAVEYGPIPEIFAREGEEYFRVVEREIVSAALDEPAVVSLGGGAVLHPETQLDLADHAVVYLTVSADDVAARLVSGKRPLLESGGIEKWSEIYEARRALYENAATAVFNTDRKPATRVADEIATWWRGLK